MHSQHFLFAGAPILHLGSLVHLPCWQRCERSPPLVPCPRGTHCLGGSIPCCFQQRYSHQQANPDRTWCEWLYVICSKRPSRHHTPHCLSSYVHGDGCCGTQRGCGGLLLRAGPTQHPQRLEAGWGHLLPWNYPLRGHRLLPPNAVGPGPEERVWCIHRLHRLRDLVFPGTAGRCFAEVPWGKWDPECQACDGGYDKWRLHPGWSGWCLHAGHCRVWLWDPCSPAGVHIRVSLWVRFVTSTCLWQRSPMSLFIISQFWHDLL